MATKLLMALDAKFAKSIYIIKAACIFQENFVTFNKLSVFSHFNWHRGCSKCSGWSGFGRTTISQGKNKIPFYKKQVINK